MPIASLARLAAATKMSAPGVTNVITRLRELGMVAEVTGRKRDRLFVYTPYLDLLSEGTEPLPR